MTLNQARMLFAHMTQVEADAVQYRWPPPSDNDLGVASELVAEGNRAYDDAIASGSKPEDYGWVKKWMSNGYEET